MIEQQKSFQEELTKLKQQISISSPQTNMEYLNQIQVLNYELQQQKMMNLTLQEKIKSVLSSQDYDDSKVKLLEEKKDEILEQVENLKQKYNDTEQQLILLKKIENEINKKKEELILIVQNNLNMYNSNDKSEVINLEISNKNNSTYNYKINNKLDMLSAIELINYSFPDLIYNVTPYNNILYYSTNENNQIICSEDIFYQKRLNVKVLGLPVGNYTIEYLLEIMNKVLNQDNIEIKLNQGNNYITIKKNNNLEDNLLTLYTDYGHYQNNILELFGFEQKQDCTNNISFTSKKSYDLRSDKIVQLYITNISETQPLCKIMLGSNRINNFMQKLSKPLENIDNLQIEFKDSKNRQVYFGDKNITLELNLKGKVSEVLIINTEMNEKKVQENSLYDEINKLLSI